MRTMASQLAELYNLPVPDTDSFVRERLRRICRINLSGDVRVRRSVGMNEAIGYARGVVHCECGRDEWDDGHIEKRAARASVSYPGWVRCVRCLDVVDFVAYSDPALRHPGDAEERTRLDSIWAASLALTPESFGKSRGTVRTLRRAPALAPNRDLY